MSSSLLFYREIRMTEAILEKQVASSIRYKISDIEKCEEGTLLHELRKHVSCQYGKLLEESFSQLVFPSQDLIWECAGDIMKKYYRGEGSILLNDNLECLAREILECTVVRFKRQFVH